MSYTSFTIDNGQLKIDKKGNGTLTVDVKNTGSRDGDEIVQPYIRDLQDKEGPLKSLRGFQRVNVKAGQTETVTLELSRQSFEFWDDETNTMRVKSGKYEILYGTSSLNEALKSIETIL